MHGGSQLDEKKHAIDCLEFYWFTKYTAQNDLVGPIQLTIFNLKRYKYCSLSHMVSLEFSETFEQAISQSTFDEFLYNRRLTNCLMNCLTIMEGWHLKC